MIDKIRSNLGLSSILLVNFIGTLGFSIVIPFLVILVKEFGGNAVVYGIVGSIYPGFQMVGAPILGRWSDRVGRKKVLLVSQVGTLLSWVVFMGALFLPIRELLKVDSMLLGAFIVSLPLVVLSLGRALDGITGGNIAVANAYLADVTDEKNRARNFGWMSIASSSGFVVGPALAGVLGGTALGAKLPVLAAIVVSLVATAVIWWMPDTKIRKQRTINKKQQPGNNSQKPDTKQSSERLRMVEILKLPWVGYMLFIYFALFLGFNVFYSVFPLHAVGPLGWSVGEMGIYFATLSVMMALVQGPVLGWATKRFSDEWLVIVGTAILGAAFVSYFFGGVVLIYVAAACFALGNGLMWPSVQSVLSKRAGDYQGAVQGLAGGGTGLASIVGLIGGGFLYQYLGAGAFLVSAGLIYFVFVVSFGLVRASAKK